MSNSVVSWLRMGDQSAGGGFVAPNSEVDYKAHSGRIDIAIPGDRGMLLIDGTWAEPASVAYPFWQGLPSWAHQAGQEYIPSLNPGHGFPRTALYAVLDSSALQQVCASSAIDLASNSFDSPWDGICYDIRNVEAGYVEKQNDFILFLTDKIHAAGFPFVLSYIGVREEDEETFQSLDVIDQASDTFLCYFFDWWLAPCSTTPYWWARKGLDNAMAHDIDPAKMYLGIGFHSRYWPEAGYGTAYDITHADALALTHGAGATIQWVEGDATGIIREKYVDLGSGARIWMQDGDTVRARLDLVDEYDLAGAMLFCAGMGNGSEWQAIGKWGMAAKGWVTPEVLNYKPGQKPAQRPTPRKRR